MQHQGSCHCGAIAFTLDADIAEVYDCNCSMCRRRGALLWFGPASAMTMHSSDAATGLYRFNRMHLEHRFCTTCGIAPYSQGINPKGERTVAINVRCLPQVDLAALTITPIDGARL
jgi:hypothetical protein